MNAAVFSAVDTGWAVGPKGMILRFSAAR
jgi:hypothetical protein